MILVDSTGAQADVDATDELIGRWRVWLEMPYPNDQYPPGSDDGVVGGVDLALVDGDAGKILADYFAGDGLDDDDRVMLPIAIAAMERALPTLAAPGRAYFAAALGLLHDVRDRGHVIEPSA
jgi:hypothetical protein